MKSLKKVFLVLNLAVVVLVFIVIVLIPRLSLVNIKSNFSLKLSQVLYHVQYPSGLPSAFSLTGPDLTIRSVYFDDRPRYGYKNAAVFLVEIRKSILEYGSVVGCEIGQQYKSTMKIHRLNVNGMIGDFIDERPSQTHTMAMIDCFNVNPKNGSSARLLYKKYSNGLLVSAESDQPFFVPPLKKTDARSYKIASCIGTAYGNPSFIGEWIHYQKTLGVDHIFLIADETFTSHRKQTQVKLALEEGFLTMQVWKQRLTTGTQIDYHSQLLAYHDCLYRSRGTFDYMLFNDQDDFFIPCVPMYKTLHHYIDRWCIKGSCAFEWIEYYPSCGMKHNSTGNGNLTMLLTSDTHKVTHLKKCLHRLAAVVEVGVHEVRELLPGFKSVKVPPSIAYMAHLRMWRRPRKCHPWEQ